jgi:carboxyl-terminal processing protease
MPFLKKKSSGAVVWAWALAMGAVLFFFLGTQCSSIFVVSKDIPSNAKENFGLMAEAWNTIHRVYVDRSAVKAKKLTYGAIGGMVDALGDTGHSTFLTPQMVQEEQEFTKGRYKGIGAEVKMKDGHVIIVAPLDGSPAQKAGLRPGEIILKVDGRGTAGLSLLQVVKRISGPPGTRVALTLLNPKTNSTRQVTLTRASITVDNVRWGLIPGTEIAQVRIAGFSEGVTKDLRNVLKKIKRQRLKGIVLDLRDDPGGLLDEAIDTASQFLQKGNVLLEKDAKGKITKFPVKSGGVAPRIPMVVLVNGGTASAAEIVAGALKDADRAPLVGEKTFGTGTVLREFPLTDGSALMLAVEEWLTPKGHTIWHQGIVPDRTVSLPEKVTPLFPREEKGMGPNQLQARGDRQLSAAVTLLRARLKAAPSKRAVEGINPSGAGPRALKKAHQTGYSPSLALPMRRAALFVAGDFRRFPREKADLDQNFSSVGRMASPHMPQNL